MSLGCDITLSCMNKVGRVGYLELKKRWSYQDGPFLIVVFGNKSEFGEEYDVRGGYLESNW